MIIKKAGIAGAWSSFANVPRFDFSLPLGIQQIPIGLEILYVDELGIIVDRAVSRRTDIVENVLAFRVRVLVLLEIPFSLVSDLGQYQRRLDRVERFSLIELLIVWIRPRAHYVGNIFFCASFGEQPLP